MANSRCWSDWAVVWASVRSTNTPDTSMGELEATLASSFSAAWSCWTSVAAKLNAADRSASMRRLTFGIWDSMEKIACCSACAVFSAPEMSENRPESWLDRPPEPDADPEPLPDALPLPEPLADPDPLPEALPLPLPEALPLPEIRSSNCDSALTSVCTSCWITAGSTPGRA